MKRFLSMLVCMSMIFTLVVFVPATASAEVEYTGPKSIYYLNFDNVLVGATGVSSYDGVNENGTNHGTDYTATVMQDEGNTNKYLNIARIGSGTSDLKFSKAPEGESVGADKYVIEYRIRPNLVSKAHLQARGGSAYGVLTAHLYNGDKTIRDWGYNGTKLGDYINGEWYTFTIVYDTDYVDENGEPWDEETSTGKKYYTRDVYLNGKLLENGNNIKRDASLGYTEFFDKSANIIHHLYLQGTGANASYDLDYMRYYASADEFAAKLPENSDTALNSIDVWFNNIPTEAELSSKVSVVDASGTKVAGVKSVSFNCEVEPGMDYAQSVNLVFDKELAAGTNYKLKINGLSDFAGNALNTELAFTTGESFEYGSFEFAGDNKTVSIDITKNISADKVYKLIIAGYEEYNGGLKMVSAAEKDITITSGTNTYTSNALDITGDYVKAFLWDDMKPVVTQGEKKPITQ